LVAAGVAGAVCSFKKRVRLSIFRSSGSILSGILIGFVFSGPVVASSQQPLQTPTARPRQTPADEPYLHSPQPGSRNPVATIEVNARLVVLDVTVTDSKGKPADGLSQADFQVYEDGRLQRIRSFDAPAAHRLPEAVLSAGASAVFDPAQPATFGRSPVDLLVLDQLNTHFADSSFARRAMRDYLARQPELLPEPTTLLSLSEQGFKSLQGFTRDRDLLLRALAAAPVEYAWQLELNGKADYGPVERLDHSLRSLEQIAQAYASIRGRKNLIWIGGGFPTLDPTTIDRGDAQEVKQDLQHVTDILLAARVTLYAVDPTTTAVGMTEITDPAEVAFANAAGDALTLGSDPFSTTDDFDKLGPVTGGRVIRGRNDVSQQIAQAIALGNDFYTLTYTPDSTSDAAQAFRRIKVVCLRPGLTATTRSGYYSEVSSRQESSVTAAYDLTTAALATVPLHGLRVAVVPDKAGSAPAGAWTIKVGVAGLTWRPMPDGGATASVYVMAVSLDAKYRILGRTLEGMTANAKPGADLKDPGSAAGFLLTAVPKAKAAILRFVVRDSASGRLGSYDIPLNK
jgi:VWFA-related protein